MNRYQKRQKDRVVVGGWRESMKGRLCCTVWVRSFTNIYSVMYLVKVIYFNQSKKSKKV